MTILCCENSNVDCWLRWIILLDTLNMQLNIPSKSNPPPLSEGQKCKLLGLNISPFKCLHTQNTLTPHTYTHTTHTHTHRHTPSTWRRIKIKSLYGVLRMNRTEWLLMQGKVWWTKGTSFKKLVGHKPLFCDHPPTEWILKQSKLLSTKGTSFENLVGHKPSFSRPPP